MERFRSNDLVKVQTVATLIKAMFHRWALSNLNEFKLLCSATGRWCYKALTSEAEYKWRPHFSDFYLEEMRTVYAFGSCRYVLLCHTSRFVVTALQNVKRFKRSEKLSTSLWVRDWNNHRVKLCTTPGLFLKRLLRRTEALWFRKAAVLKPYG